MTLLRRAYTGTWAALTGLLVLVGCLVAVAHVPPDALVLLTVGTVVASLLLCWLVCDVAAAVPGPSGPRRYVVVAGVAVAVVLAAAGLGRLTGAWSVWLVVAAGVLAPAVLRWLRAPATPAGLHDAWARTERELAAGPDEAARLGLVLRRAALLDRLERDDPAAAHLLLHGTAAPVDLDAAIAALTDRDEPDPR